MRLLAFVYTRSSLAIWYIAGHSALVSPAATINRISPTLGRPGDIVTITGSGFSLDPSNVDVRFGPNRAPVLTSSGAELTVQVPNGQPYAPTQVSVDGSNRLLFNTASNTKPPIPNICMCCCCPNSGGGTSNAPCAVIPAGGGLSLDRGEFFDFQTDLSIPGRPGADRKLQYSFQRYYRNQITTDSPMGNKWDHNYFEHLEFDIDGGIIHHNGLGRSDKYLKNNRGDLVAPVLFYAKLVRHSDGSLLLQYPDGTTKSFAVDGKLLEIRDRNNNFISLFYNAQRQLIRVTDTQGRDIVYRYLPSGANAGRLMEIEDFLGRKVSFSYDPSGDLTAVTGPAVIGTSNANDFPLGKTTKYSYSNHNLLTETRPNEVASGGPPVLINEYGTDPASFSYNKVIRMTYGGTNSSGVAGGGQYTFSYTQLNPSVLSDDPNLVVSRTHETDRNGNVKEYEFTRLGYPTIIREFTRGLRPSDPPVYVTSMQYNADGRLLQKTMPEGDQMLYLFDEGNADRLQQGNMLRMTHVPGPRGGNQASLVTTYTYEPRFNQIKTTTDPRGNDPAFVPPNGGPNSAARYTTLYTFDYEAGGPSNGNIIRKQQPTVTLPDGTTQFIITDYTYNQFGQLASETDPEGNVTLYQYCPTSTPSCPTPDPTGGGYLHTKIVDATTSPRRTETAPPAHISNQFFRDPVGNIIRTIDGRGNDMVYSVNALNQVVRTISEAPYRYIQDTFYDANNNIIRRDIENRVASQSDGKPIFASEANFTTQAGTPASFQHRFTFNILDLLVQKDIDAAGSVPSRLITRYRYDANENRTQEIFPEGNVFATVYDERDLAFTVTRGLGSPQASTFIYSYDRNRNLVSFIDAEDKNGDGKNDETIYRFDGYDRYVATIDAVGDQTITAYDPNSQVIKTASLGPIGGTSPLNNSGGNNVLLAQRELLRDELDREYQHDDLLFIGAGTKTVRMPVLIEGPLTPNDGKVSKRFFFDRNGRVIKEIQDDLDMRLMEYDGVNRPVKTTDPEGNIETRVYDLNNNAVQIVQFEKSQRPGVAAETFTTTNQFDARNRLTITSDNCKNTRRSAYDSRDNLTHATDAKADDTTGCSGTVNGQGNSMRYSYDGSNRQLQLVRDLRVGGVGSGAIDTSNPANPDGSITTKSSWDGNNRLSSLTDDNGNTTVYQYDVLNRAIQETLPDSSTTVYSYDRDDNVISVKDNNGTVQNHTYDAINRRVRSNINRSAAVIGTTLNEYEFDGLSRITKATDNNEPTDATDDSSILFTYDSLSRVIEENQNGRAIDSDWFAADRRIGLTYPNARKLLFSYDTLDRLKTIQDVGTSKNIVEYTYIGPTRVLERLYQNGVRLSYLNDAGTVDIGYDGIKRTVLRRDLRVDNSLVVGFAYQYDREHNKQTENKLHSPAATSEAYAYDSAYRITDFVRPSSRTEQWALDGVGNWTKDTINGGIDTRTINTLNQYTSAFSTSHFYDKNGNLINDGALGYIWDFKNRIRMVCTLDRANPNVLDNSPGTPDDCLAPGAKLIASYSYDAMNRRIRKTVMNSGELDGAVEFYYDIAKMIEEQSPMAALGQQYVYGLYLDERLTLDRVQSHERLFYHQNTLSSTFALTDASGAVVEAYLYDAYGAQTVFGPGFSTTLGVQSAQGNTYTFTGQRIDVESGLYLYRNRYLSSKLGRFVSRDPLSYDSVLNYYTYTGNRPTGFVDPFGLTEWSANVKLTYSPPNTLNLPTDFAKKINGKELTILDLTFSVKFECVGPSCNMSVLDFSAPKKPTPEGEAIDLEIKGVGVALRTEYDFTPEFPKPEQSGDCIFPKPKVKGERKTKGAIELPIGGGLTVDIKENIAPQKIEAYGEFKVCCCCVETGSLGQATMCDWSAVAERWFETKPLPNGLSWNNTALIGACGRDKTRTRLKGIIQEMPMRR